MSVSQTNNLLQHLKHALCNICCLLNRIIANIWAYYTFNTSSILHPTACGLVSVRRTKIECCASFSFTSPKVSNNSFEMDSSNHLYISLCCQIHRLQRSSSFVLWWEILHGNTWMQTETWIPEWRVELRQNTHCSSERENGELRQMKDLTANPGTTSVSRTLFSFRKSDRDQTVLCILCCTVVPKTGHHKPIRPPMKEPYKRIWSKFTNEKQKNHHMVKINPRVNL